MLNMILIEGLMTEYEEIENGIKLNIEYKDYCFLDVICYGKVAENVKNNFKVYRKAGFVATFDREKNIVAESVKIDIGIKYNSLTPENLEII